MKHLVFSLLVLSITGAVFNTGLFIYESLSFYFSFTLLTFFMCGILSVYTLRKREKRRDGMVVTPGGLFFFIWILYVVTHTLFISESDHYKIFLLVGFFLFYLLSLNLTGQGLFSREQLVVPFLLLALAETIICLLQFGGILGSRSPFFRVTGSFENPNIAAMYLVSCLPFVLFSWRRSREKSFSLAGFFPSLAVFLFSLVLLVAALVLLRCRSAYVAGIVVFLVFIITSEKWISLFEQIALPVKISGGICLLAILLTSSYFLYNLKKESSEGRLFIWKLSTQMVVEKPLTGYGYGLFAKEYNLRQAAWFKSGKGSESEKRNAAYVNMAYNEYIEQGVEGGLPGLILYCMLLGFHTRSAFRGRDYEAFSVILAYAFMGCFNFVIQAIPAFMILILYMASSPSGERSIHLKDRFSISFLLLLSVGLFLSQSTLLHAQLNLKRASSLLKEERRGEALEQFVRNAGMAGTSEAFFRLYGKTLAGAGRYTEAIPVLKRASRYTSQPAVFYDLAESYARSDQSGPAEEALKTVSDMIPTNLRSRYRLMLLYERLGEKAEAEAMAGTILSIVPKVETRESNFYQQKAKEYRDR